MPTLEENVNRVKAAKTAIGNAITAKGGTVGANDGLEDFAADIGTIPSGGGGGSLSNDVNFYDYDGTIVNSYTAAEFANLSAMPDNPTHEGLTPQGWNWSLNDAKSYVATYGKLEIGQMYVTSDGKTRIYITFSEGGVSPYLKLYLSQGSLDIDWGDGSEHSTWTGPGYKKEQHTYANSGDYVITITPSDNTRFKIYGEANGLYKSKLLNNDTNRAFSVNTTYLDSIQRIELGAYCELDEYAFCSCRSLKTIIIPNTITTIPQYTFNGCTYLRHITLPNSITRLNGNSISECISLKSASIPNSVVICNGYAFYSDILLEVMTLPSLSVEGYCFSDCYSLKEIYGVGMNNTSTNHIRNCYNLTTIKYPDTTSIIPNYCFYGCRILKDVSISNNITTIGTQAFYNNEVLTSITIPSTVTSIANDAFYCPSLTSITIDKAEGSISGAPWGATNATITWTG